MPYPLAGDVYIIAQPPSIFKNEICLIFGGTWMRLKTSKDYNSQESIMPVSR